MPLKWTGLLLLSLTTTALAAPRYAITRLGVLPGDKVSVADGINESGQVVGFSGGGFDSDRKAVIWNGGVIAPLAHLPGMTYSSAHDISDVGTIVGFSSLGDNGGRDSAAVRWTAPHTPQNILPGTGGSASGINASGQITGTYYSATTFHPYLWQDGAGLTTLATTDASYANGVGNAINAAGQVVGHQKGALTPFRAVRWNAAPSEIALPVGFDNSQARGINIHGHVVGGMWSGATGDTSAYLWTGAGDAQPLPSGDMTHGSGQDINDVGQIVGQIYNVGGSADRHAALWEAGAVHDLNDLIDPASGWTLTSAGGINESGLIVGYGVYNSQTEAFLLTPIPEPAGLALLVCSAFALASRRSGRGKTPGRSFGAEMG